MATNSWSGGRESVGGDVKAEEGMTLPSLSSINQQANNVDAAASTEDSNYKPLNVKDALSYLEQVKFQFSSRPDIYNLFLDIMKDFKSQNIDTPGVIERVSTLFKGFNNLIQGFNTFLPPGYRIECSQDPNDPIKVITPVGNSTVMINNVNSRSQTPTLHSNGNALTNGPQNNQSSGLLGSRNNSLAKMDNGAIPVAPRENISQQQTLDDSRDKVSSDVEFSQAISYVNKIKTRFMDQPDIYKQFLEILQTYQREQKPISEVYQQVEVLFHDAPDLLDDFKRFLPDNQANNEHIQGTGYSVPITKGSYTLEGPVNQPNLPPIGSFPPPLNTNGPPNSYDIAMRQQQVHNKANSESSEQSHQAPDSFNVRQNMMNLSSMMTAPSTNQGNLEEIGHQSKETNSHSQLSQNSPHGHASSSFLKHQADIYSNDNVALSGVRDTIQYTENNRSRNNEYLDNAVGSSNENQLMDDTPVRPEIDLDPSLVPVVPEPTQPIEDNLNLSEETTFFEKVKKFLGNKQTYMEFLKFLNLYSQDLITLEDLVNKVSFYLASSEELLHWFKVFVGYSDSPKTMEAIIHEKHKLDLDMCEAYGPSYKRLPKTDTYMPCSGRDEMCWEILNDEWVGHPVWASEDSGYIAHRKNQYEETLFKIEEERHEYDYYIESNLRTIQTLETIANKIENMGMTEKMQFKLPPGLSHSSTTIYKKVIRKVYDKERGYEMIDLLHEFPAFAVPLILKRLKQKDEEWRRYQREWNKVWRDLEQKVFFKSLDHLGLTFKQADKKLLTTKQLVSEISSIKVDQTNKRIHWLTPKPQSQLDYDFPDTDVFFDVLKLATVFVVKNSTYSNPEKERLKDFFKVFTNLVFNLPYDEIKQALRDFEKELELSSKLSTSEPSSNESNKRTIYETEREVDVRSLREILKRTRYQKIKFLKDSSGGKSPTFEDGIPENEESDSFEYSNIEQDLKKPWLMGNLVEKTNLEGLIYNRQVFNFIANTNIYVFLRHYITLYERLLEVKNINEEVTRDISARKVTKFAEDLDLTFKQLKQTGLEFDSTDAYRQLLKLSMRLIEGEVEHQWFEESLRQAYNNKAFKIYTIDKVIQSLVKHAYTLMTDSKTADIMNLFEKDRLCENTSTKDQILYRLQARSYMSNTENMFRIELDKLTRHVSIQYVALDDLTLAEPTSLEDRWKYYLTSYALPHPTEGIEHGELKLPFLERIVEFDQEYDVDADDKISLKVSPEGTATSSLRISIDPEDYSLNVECGSYDVFSRNSLKRFPRESTDKLAKKATQVKDRINQVLNKKFENYTKRKEHPELRLSSKEDGDSERNKDQEASGAPVTTQEDSMLNPPTDQSI